MHKSILLFCEEGNTGKSIPKPFRSILTQGNLRNVRRMELHSHIVGYLRENNLPTDWACKVEARSLSEEDRAWRRIFSLCIAILVVILYAWVCELRIIWHGSAIELQKVVGEKCEVVEILGEFFQGERQVSLLFDGAYYSFSIFQVAKSKSKARRLMCAPIGILFTFLCAIISPNSGWENYYENKMFNIYMLHINWSTWYVIRYLSSSPSKKVEKTGWKCLFDVVLHTYVNTQHSTTTCKFDFIPTYPTLQFSKVKAFNSGMNIIMLSIWTAGTF